MDSSMLNSNISNSQSTFSSAHMLSDGEVLALGVKPSDVESYRRMNYTASFGIDTWYNTPLRDYTFKTNLLPLSYEEASAVLNKHYKKSLTTLELQSLENLKSRIDEALKEFENGAFIKLNTRSPKDVPIYDFKSDKVQKLVLQEFKKLESSERNDNTETIAFIKATTKATHIHTADEAMQLLDKSSRISEDISRRLHFGKDLWKAQLVIREWLDDLPEKPQMEFRGFVHKNNLNALTQYYSFCYFPDLVQNKENIQKRIIEFFELIKPNLAHHSSYVIDFFVSDNKVYIIEMNPFHVGAGAGLFSWKEDRELFLNGPFEFRIVTAIEKLPENPKDFIPNQWVRFLKEKLPSAAVDMEDGTEREESERRVLWWPWTALLVVGAGIYIYTRKYSHHK